MERHKFYTRVQKDGELFQSFVADLRILANTCEYGTLKDELIRDKMQRHFSTRTKAVPERERSHTRSRH